MVANLESECVFDTFNKPGPGLGRALARQKYDVCILMAGTNDLAANRTAEQILSDLKTLHGYCHARGIRTVALTIPESRFISEAFYQIPASVRRKVNRGLNHWARTLGDKVIFVDMASQVPYSAFSGDWHPDGLHMSQQGYRNFGEKLGNLIRSFVAGSPPLAQSNSKASQRFGDLMKWMGTGLPMVDLTNRNGSSAFINAPKTFPFQSSSAMLQAQNPQGQLLAPPIIW